MILKLVRVSLIFGKVLLTEVEKSLVKYTFRKVIKAEGIYHGTIP